jgi:hypothetical protein
MFVLEQQLNVQNDRVWYVSLSDIPREKLTVPRYQNAAAFMVWSAILRKGRLPLVFIDRGLKINSEYYTEKRNRLGHTKFFFVLLLPAKRGAITHSNHRSEVVRR